MLTHTTLVSFFANTPCSKVEKSIWSSMYEMVNRMVSIFKILIILFNFSNFRTSVIICAWSSATTRQYAKPREATEPKLFGSVASTWSPSCRVVLQDAAYVVELLIRTRKNLIYYVLCSVFVRQYYLIFFDAVVEACGDSACSESRLRESSWFIYTRIFTLP